MLSAKVIAMAQHAVHLRIFTARVVLCRLRVVHRQCYVHARQMLVRANPSVFASVGAPQRVPLRAMLMGLLRVAQPLDRRGGCTSHGLKEFVLKKRWVYYRPGYSGDWCHSVACWLKTRRRRAAARRLRSAAMRGRNPFPAILSFLVPAGEHMSIADAD